jgi:predicted peptidase
VAGSPAGSGLESVPDDICSIKDLAIWVFHGDADTAVPIENNLESVAALELCGASNVQMTIYEGLNHSPTWLRAYGDVSLFEWMLEQIN